MGRLRGLVGLAVVVLLASSSSWGQSIRLSDGVVKRTTAQAPAVGVDCTGAGQSAADVPAVVIVEGADIGKHRCCDPSTELWVDCTAAGGGGGGLGDPGANGIVARIALNNTVARTITGDSEIVVADGSGVSGNPTLSIAATLTRDSELTAHAGDADAHYTHGALAAKSAVAGGAGGDVTDGTITMADDLAGFLSSAFGTKLTDETGSGRVVFNGLPTFTRGMLVDSDNDGLPDQAFVGDWDGDGSYEVADIRAAIAALTDTGSKYVKLGPYTFAGDTDCLLASQALVELPSNTTLEGSGWATVIRGAGVTGSLSCPVVANEQYRLQSSTDSNVIVRDLTIDGAFPDGTGNHAGFTRQGLAFTRCSDCKGSNLNVHHTAHTCLYASLSDGITFADSVVDHCGAFSDTSGTLQPCIYLFANSIDIQNVTVDGIEASRCALNGLNNRNNLSGDRTKNVSWRNIRVTGAVNAQGTLPACASFAGTLNMSFDNVTCVGTNQFDLNDATAYYDTGGSISLGSKNMTIAGLRMFDSGGLSIGDYQANLSVTDLVVSGNTGSGSNDCVVLNTPARRFRLDGALLTECAGDGIQLNGATGQLPDERVELRNVTIDGTDAVNRVDGTGQYGLYVVTSSPTPAHRGLVLENMSITGATHSAIRFLGTVSSSRFANLTLDGVLPSYLGEAATVGAMGTCDAAKHGKWYMFTTAATTSDCSTGSGSSRSQCVCNNGTGWQAYTPGSPRQGMDFDPTTSHESLSISGVTVRNYDGDFGMWIKASNSLLTDIVGDDEELFTEARQSGALYLTAGSSNTQVVRAVCDPSLNTGNPCVRRNVTSDDEPQTWVGTSCPSACNNGDVCHDIDGDGTTNCGGNKCTLAVCTVTGSPGTWHYLN